MIGTTACTRDGEEPFTPGRFLGQAPRPKRQGRDDHIAMSKPAEPPRVGIIQLGDDSRDRTLLDLPDSLAG